MQFLSRANGYTLFLTPSEAVFSLRNSDKNKPASVLRMKLVDANADAKLSGEQTLQGKVNYLIGNDRNNWHANIPTFRQVVTTMFGAASTWFGMERKARWNTTLLLTPAATSVILIRCPAVLFPGY